MNVRAHRRGAGRALGALGLCAWAACGSSRENPDDGGRDGGPGDLVIPLDGGDGAPPPVDGPLPHAAWAMVLEGGSATSVTSVVADGDGNAYVAIQFDQSLRLPDETLTAVGGVDGVVVKVSSSGSVLWRRAIGGPGTDLISSLVLTAEGTLWGIGRFEQTLALPGASLTSLGASDVLLVNLSAATGDVISARGFGGGEADWGNVVGIDAAQRLVLGGWFRDQMSLDDRLVAPSPMQWDGFLALLAPGATRPDWVHVLGGFGQDGVSGVATSTGGDIAVTGIQDGTANYGCGTLSFTALSQAFVVRYGADGSCRFSKSYGSLGWNGAGGVAFAPSGDLVVAGAFEGPIDFGGGQTVSNCVQINCNDGFLVRLDANGDYRWAHTWGDGTGDDGVSAVAVTATDQVYADGTFYGTLNIGGNAFPSAGGSDGFATLLSATGQVLWATAFGSEADDSLGPLALAPAALYLGGKAGGTLTTPPGLRVITAANNGGALLIRFDRPDGATP